MKEGFVSEFLLPIIKALLFSVCLTLVSVLLFALIIKLTTFSFTAVKIVNQFIKVISVFLGCFFFIKEGKGLIKGGISGIVYAVTVSLIFSIISGNGVSLSWLDILLCLFVGIISGIISVNVRS